MGNSALSPRRIPERPWAEAPTAIAPPSRCLSFRGSPLGRQPPVHYGATAHGTPASAHHLRAYRRPSQGLTPGPTEADGTFSPTMIGAESRGYGHSWDTIRLPGLGLRTGHPTHEGGSVSPGLAAPRRTFQPRPVCSAPADFVPGHRSVVIEPQFLHPREQHAPRARVVPSPTGLPSAPTGDSVTPKGVSPNSMDSR